MNPFGTDAGYNEDAAIALANPISGDFYPNGVRNPYFRIAKLAGSGSKVWVRVLGAIDIDGDGEAGLPVEDEEGFEIDSDDIHRRIEAYIGLPDSLGHDISAGALQGFEDAGGSDLTFGAGTFSLFGESLSVLLDDPGDPGLILESPIETGNQVELPLGLFDQAGAVNTDYFADCDKDVLTGPQSFDGGASYTGKEIALVTDDVTISGHWGGKDLTVISTTRITATATLDCGLDGRLVLIAPDIDLNGTVATRINGIVVSGNDIHLIGDGARPITNQDDAAIFAGTLLAGGRIILEQSGWVVAFDEGIINGRMFPLPTLTYDDMEDAETLNRPDDPPDVFPVHWSVHKSGSHSISALGSDPASEGDPAELGLSVMHVVFRNLRDDSGSSVVGDAAYLDLRYGTFSDSNVEGFEDGEGYHNWSGWDRISFWMKLNNWRHTSTIKTAKIRLTLTDANGFKARKIIDYNHYVDDPGSIDNANDLAVWEHVEISFSDFASDPGFDRSRTGEIRFSYADIQIDADDPVWTFEQRLSWNSSSSHYQYWFRDPFWPPGWTEPMHIEYDPGNPEDSWLYWEELGVKYYIYGYDEAVVVHAKLRSPILGCDLFIDNVEIPGGLSPNYGLPSCFQYEVTRWNEMS
jgi:hypothetical protein